MNDLSPKFQFGGMYTTPGVHQLIESGEINHGDILACLFRHLEGDFGDVCEEDKAANLEAIYNGDRILSAYNLTDDVRIWIITEGDRSATTILLPEEY